MRNKLLTTLFILFNIGIIAIIWTLVQNNQGLFKQIDAKNELISNIKTQDSINYFETKKYSEVITKYVDNCTLSIDGKKITLDELVVLLNSADEKNIVLFDSILKLNRMVANQIKLIEIYKNNIDKYADSTFYYKSAFGMVQRDYGNSYAVERIENGIVFKKNFTRVDSALLLYNSYKDKLKFDSTTGNWIIYGERQFPEINNKNNKKITH